MKRKKLQPVDAKCYDAVAVLYNPTMIDAAMV
jgi:hypothetical protein